MIIKTKYQKDNGLPHLTKERREINNIIISYPKIMRSNIKYEK